MKLIEYRYPDAEDIEKLRVHKGDVVDYQGTRYVATEVGMRYLHMHLQDNPRITGFAKLSDVSNWFPPAPEEMADYEMRTPLIKGR